MARQQEQRLAAHIENRRRDQPVRLKARLLQYHRCFVKMPVVASAFSRESTCGGQFVSGRCVLRCGAQIPSKEVPSRPPPVQTAIVRSVVALPDVSLDAFSNLCGYVLSNKRREVRRSGRRLSAHLCRFPSCAKVSVTNLLVHFKAKRFQTASPKVELSRSRRRKGAISRLLGLLRLRTCGEPL
jgi:hypothetical protein